MLGQQLSKWKKWQRAEFTVLLTMILASCSSPPIQKESLGHIGLESEPPAPIATDNLLIPPMVKHTAILPKPKNAKPLETFTVTVNEVPIKELLFALARDAKMNLDIYDDIDGVITLNAIDQTLPQILDRLGRQANIRYEIKEGNISISADKPYLKTYKIDYVNLERKTASTLELSTQIAESSVGERNRAGSNNNSKLMVSNDSNHAFWFTLFQNIVAIISEKTVANNKNLISENVIINRETGLLSVRASQQQHHNIQQFIDFVMESARRQVLIEATVAEVSLSNHFQSGIDWSRNPFNIGPDGNPLDDFSINQSLTGARLSNPPANVLNISEIKSDYSITAGVRLLEEFGHVRVLSSPKMMALNNQTAVLKVVDNHVYFTIEIDTTQNETQTSTTFESEVHTVPIGLVMSITPYISDSGEVMLNVRPTISRVLGFINDPNPSLATQGIENPIPQIQVREMESVLRLNNGQIGVIGGLMQDRSDSLTDALPGVSRLAVVGEAFKAKDKKRQKTELVVFIRPIIVNSPSLDGDLRHLKAFLPVQQSAK